jgi:hypothetical protein
MQERIDPSSRLSYAVVVSRVLPTQDRSRITLQIWNLYSANKLSMTRRFAVSRSGRPFV